MSTPSSSSSKYVLVVGATGATGKHVVSNLLEKDRKVKVIVRSKSKMIGLLTNGDEYETKGQLIIKETPSLSSISNDELTSYLADCDTIVQCLGHVLSYQGMYKDGMFVSQTVERLTTLMPDKCKFLLMGSDGVAHPDKTTDPKQTFGERCVYWLLRCLVPPHVDNEKSALYVYEKCPTKDWVVVRPSNLIETETADTKYEIYMSQQVSPIFGDRETSRANVAYFMTQLVTDDTLWEQYNHCMPVIYNMKKDDQSKKAK
jgi:NAD(P)H-binding